MKKIWFAGIIIWIAFFMFGTTANLTAQELDKTIYQGKTEDLKALLAKGLDPNSKLGKETILGVSINGKYPEIPITLINTKGIKVNEYSIHVMPEVSWKYTPLMKTVSDINMMKLLVEKGALVDLQDEYLTWNGERHESGGNTTLMLAVGNPKETYFEAVKFLVEKAAKLDIQNRSGNTALMFAVFNTEISKYLIDKGAAIDIQNKGGETALMLAARKYTDVVKLLLDKGANIVLRQTSDRSTPNALDNAAIYGNIDAAKLIIARAVTLGVKDEIISGSLRWAVLSNQLEMAKYLLDEGAIIEGTDAVAKYTPLMLATKPDIVQLLVKRGANVNALSAFGYSPLNKAVANFLDPDLKESDNEKIFNLLLEKGAKLDVLDGNGSTALMYAVQKITPFKILIAKGAAINIQNKNGETALMLAVKGGLVKTVLFMPVVGPFKDAVKLLISKGADINLQDAFGKTALMHASGALNAMGDDYSSYTEVLQLLLDNGAKIEAMDKDKNTALYWAQRYNRTKSADLLISKGANAAKKYDRTKDKSNVAAGIVGIWDQQFKIEGQVYTTRVVFKSDWTYSKVLKAPKNQVVPDGGAYKTYDLRDGRIFLFNQTKIPAVIEYRFEGKNLILNGEKYSKAVK